MSRSSLVPGLPHSLPSPIEVFLRCFAAASATVLPLPRLVKAYCLALLVLPKAPEASSESIKDQPLGAFCAAHGIGVHALDRKIRAAWTAIEALEKAGVLRRRARRPSEIPAEDRELCPKVGLAVFGEVELLRSSTQSRDEGARRPSPSEEPYSPVALCA